MSVALTSLGPSADAVAHDIDRLHGPVTLVRRTTDLVEVLSVVRSGLARAVLVAEGAEQFGAEAMDALQEARAVVAVLEGFDDDRLVELGAIFIPADLQAAEAASILVEEAERAAHQQPRGRPAESAEAVLEQWSTAPDAGFSGAGAGQAAEQTPQTAAAFQDEAAATAAHPAAAGLVVVWGAHGSPGRTTVAVNVAAELAVSGHRVMLVDLDTWGPSVAHLLGLLDETAGVALACRAADRHQLDPAALDRAAVRVELGAAHLDVLTGLTRSERWPELRGGSVSRLLRACREVSGTPGEQHPIVVVDVGFCLEEDEELSFDTQAPRRNAAAITALAEADLVVAVASADVVGLPRAVKSIPGVLERTEAPVMVVANKVRKAAAGRSPRSGVREAWESMGAPVAITDYVSFDPTTVDRAALDGSVLAESAAGSTVRAELKAVADNVLRRLAGETAQGAGPEQVRETSFGRRMSAWLRR
ncbi:AAA family ATPase [Kocuria sp.]|uniref:AAA family ATPase n=1 Tax=Kocuria sp. TaxID=1871328 RepID=UPI0026DF1A37|nr:P-loop NTPase [Kocuria sp.]MDO5619589.1 P-loop NTPase [Kocuria sp.]